MDTGIEKKFLVNFEQQKKESFINEIMATEIEETESFLAKASYPGVKSILQSHLNKLRKDEENKTIAAAKAAAAAAAAAEKAAKANESTNYNESLATVRILLLLVYLSHFHSMRLFRNLQLASLEHFTFLLRILHGIRGLITLPSLQFTLNWKELEK